MLRPTIFQSTLPVGGATPIDAINLYHGAISIHAPRGGSDSNSFDWGKIIFYFNPRSPWGERLLGHGIDGNNVDISIHAPRGGSDNRCILAARQPRNFNPRSPWGERHTIVRAHIPDGLFQSTLPVGGATLHLFSVFAQLGISIHAPRGGSDVPSLIWELPPVDFNPRSPWGERLLVSTLTPGPRVISIHAPRGGSDGLFYVGVSQHNYFNPRSPWGERRRGSNSLRSLFIFQSTLPVGGATYEDLHKHHQNRISIHAPRGGSDRRGRPVLGLHRNFNPRSPWGERR